MEEILKQVGELALNSVPTVILFVLLWSAYYVLLHRPLLRVLEERHAKTVGAIEQSRADVAAADARTAEYEQLLREAKLGIYKYLEGRRQKSLEAREAALGEARKAADEQVRAAKTALDKDLAQAQVRLRSEADALANAVVRTILKPVGLASSQVAGGRS